MCDRAKLINRLLVKIKNLDDDFLKNIIGDLGLEIKNFSNIIDLENEYINSISEDSNYELLYEFINLAEYAYENKYNLSLDYLKNDIKNLTIKKIRIPNKSNLFTRFRNDKNNLRLSKKPWKFCSNFFYENISLIWHETPDDFNFFEEDVDFISFKDKELRYESIGCDDMARSVSRFIGNINGEKYKGYKKIDINVAACIVAKLNSIKKQNKYQPVLYPINYLENIIPHNIIKKIKNIDNLFDHFVVFIPSFEDSDLNSDMIFFKKNKSLILGEVDGFFYYICTC